ncbi:MAG: beta-N-acetylhexosaminidase [Balneolaceae bacterium]
MNKIKTIVVFLLLALFLDIHMLHGQQNIPLVPNPQEVEFSEGVFYLDGDISMQFYLNDGEEEHSLFTQLEKEFASSLFTTLQKDQEIAGKQIIVGVGGINSAFDELVKNEDIVPSPDLGSEGYFLLVDAEQVIISANTITGAFYGVQTLKQLIRTNRGEKSISALKIKDWPDLEIRGMMDDISRGPVPTKEYMRQQIERMAEMKVNLLTYYTQDVVKTESHPAFAPPGGALDIDEWAELADYAKKFHIDLVGNFQSFGHFDQILKHPEYEHLGESGTLLSPAFEESYELLKDIYTEMIPAFHSDYFHINSDETFDLGSGASKEMVDSLGMEVVYSNHINRIYDIITGLGKKVMMWGDIALDHPKILELLPKDIILITWSYDAMDDFAPRLTPFKEAGFTQLASTGILNSYSTIPDFRVARGNIGGFVAEMKKQNAWGILNTVWDDGGFALFSRDWYGVAFAADQSWHSNPNDPTYDSRFNRAVYAATNNGLSEAIHELNKLADLKSTEKMNEDILWAKIIPEKGEEVLMNIGDWEKVLEIVTKAEGHLQKFDPSIYSKDAEFIKLTIDQYKFLAESRPKLVEAANLYKQAYDIQNEEKIKARALLVETYGLLSEVYQEQLSLKTTNQYLWTVENRVYALDRVVEKYDEHISAFKEVRNAVLNAMHAYDKEEELPAASDIRLDIEESEGWYFQGWLMIEPIANEAGFQDPGVDHLEDMGGVETTFPNVTEEFYFNGDKYRWARVNTSYFAKVDLDELFDRNENVVMYAFAHIDIPEDRNVRALAGSSDGIEVFINGKSVHKNYEERDFQLDEDELYLPLRKGRNHLMLKITQSTGDWAFSFRLPDAEMRSYKNRYKIIE